MFLAGPERRWDATGLSASFYGIYVAELGLGRSRFLDSDGVFLAQIAYLLIFSSRTLRAFALVLLCALAGSVSSFIVLPINMISMVISGLPS